MVSETRTIHPSRRNVPEDLDSRIPANYSWYLAVLGCIGGFLFGYAVRPGSQERWNLPTSRP